MFVGLFTATNDGVERHLIRLREQEFEMPVARLFGVQQEIIPDLPLRETIERLAISYGFSQRRQHQGHRGQTLLTINNKQRRLMRDLRQATFDVHDGANEVDRDLIVAARAHDVVPQLPALLLRPRVGALINGDNELR